MASFTVYFKRKKVGEYEFEGGRIRVGRHPESEIFLPHQSVSRLHAVLNHGENGWIVENVGGKNGLFLNGGLVRMAMKVSQGDRIEFGNYLIHVAGAEEGGELMAELEKLTGASAASSGGLSDPPPIAPRPTGVEEHENTFRMTPAQVVAQRREASQLANPHLIWRGDSGEEVIVPLGKEEMTIGTGPEANIQLPGGLLTGKIHARVKSAGKGHSVAPMAWWCKVLVNGRKVKDSQKLTDGDRIEIAGTVLSYRAALIQ